MASNSTSQAYPPPPPGTNYLAVIDEGLPFLMIGATMGAVLFAMLLALMFFSTPSMRCSPMFILNIVVVLLGLAGAVLNMYMEIQTFTSPLVSLPTSMILTMSVLNGFTPILVDCILLLRLVAVFPRQRTPRYLWLAIMGVPILIKIARMVNFIFFVVYQTREINNLVKSRTSVGGASILLTVLPNVKIEWIFQVFDDLFSSSLFLWRVYREGMFEVGQSVSEKVKQLFWISTYNFVFPVLLSLAQIVIYMINEENYLTALYIEEANFHFSIMGLVFATVWAAEGRWKDERSVGHTVGNSMSAVRFAPGGRQTAPKEALNFMPAPNESMQSIGPFVASSEPSSRSTSEQSGIEGSREKEFV
ncbi:hypothetical protein BDN67DRAFT_810209 [Paxillus ammoniavirescens]|nr:hypothetical protein BDN67DRAFT_810209 [Paxillus ammoniavirescens]